MKAAKKGEKLVCGSCGMAVVVCDECGCEAHELVCCGEPMKKAKPAAAKPKKAVKKTAKKK
jgi:hypothetical protein